MNADQLRAALDRYERERLDPIADQYAHGLPEDQLYTFEGQTVRLRFGYGFAAVSWGPKYLNKETPGLDADPLTVNGKTYERGAHVTVQAHDLSAEVSDVLGKLTDSARRYVEELAPRIVDAYVDDNPEDLTAWLDAEEKNKRASHAREVRRAIEKLRGPLAVPIEHTHRGDGQQVRHVHTGGHEAHSYYDHPEDA